MGSDWAFSKICKELQNPYVVMFEMGEFRKPTAILDGYDIARLVKEYGIEKILAKVKEITPKR
jgi:hypothetical protein